MPPIYDKPVRSIMHQFVQDARINPDTVFSRETTKNWFKEHYPKIKDGTVNAHLLRMSVNAPSRVHHSLVKGEDDLFYQIDSQKFRLYDPKTDPTPVYDAEDPESSIVSEDAEDKKPGSQEFAYEKDLQSYLVNNLGILEPGLSLYEEEGIRGIEFPAGKRYIDILAIDKNNDFVVIELKVSKGYDRVVGQLLRYVSWIRKNLAVEHQKVRGIIIARNISLDLELACSELSDVQLFEYELTVNLKEKYLT